MEEDTQVDDLDIKGLRIEADEDGDHMVFDDGLEGDTPSRCPDDDRFGDCSM